MPRDDENLPLLVAGIALVTGGVAWMLWPKATAPVPPLGYVPPSPRAPSEAPVTLPPFLAAAPPAGAARERYFEAAVDAPTWTEVILSPRVKVRVTTDYMTSQGIRVPLWPSTAQRVADRFDAILPTKTLVDAIWRAATVKVSPHSMTPRPDAPRDSNRLLAEHEAIVDAQVAGRAGLVAGNKKDLTVGRTAAAHPDRVTIFGWHRLDGSVIQDPSWVHNARYGADYAHGTRLVSRTAFVDGRPVPIEQVFADPSLAPLVNESGTLTPAQLAYPRS
jgi:hypothetical protein